jgi:DNA-binding MarR family transcriptional regulator
MQEPMSVADLLTYRFLRLSNTLGLYASRRYREEFGISLPEWRVMSIVALREPTTARDVSRVLATDKGWVGLSLERLRRRGYLTRSSDRQDARRTLVNLTEKGRRLHNAILSVARWRQQRLLATLSAGAAATLTASLDRLQLEADHMLEELEASSRHEPAATVTKKGSVGTTAAYTPAPSAGRKRRKMASPVEKSR